MASADWREKLSVEDVMKVIKAAHPQCAEHPAELRRLSEKALGVTSDNGKETAAAEADRTAVAGPNRISNAELLALLLSLNLTQED